MLQHLGEEAVMGAVVPPIFQTSLFVFDDFDTFQGSFGNGAPHVYSRINNPTLDILNQKIAMLEGAEQAKTFGSGMAAITTACMSVLKSGSHVVLIDTVYGPTRKFLCDYMAKFGVTTTIVDGRSVENIQNAITPQTDLVFLESPSSLLFRLQDLKAIADLCRSKGISTIIDNTYGLCIQKPLALGIDLVVHSASKMISGHSDVVAGAICGSNERLNKIHFNELELFGSIISPHSAWLLIRGLRTLPLRIKRSSETANIVASWLENRPEITEVLHLGLSSFNQAAVRDLQMTGTGSLFSILPKTQDRAKIKAFIESLCLFQTGVSWGGHESLVVAMPLQPMDWSEPRWVIRLNCGFEDPKDLISDLENALRHLA